MQEEFGALSYTPLRAGTRYAHPPEPPEWVYLDSPALEVMTDFEIVHPVTTGAEVPIDEALEHMKKAGVRLLLVTDDHDEIIGLLTAYDIMGERPTQVVEASRIPRAEVTVAMIMTPREAIVALNLMSVRNAQVGHIVATLNQLERQHVLVVEVDEQTKGQRVRGLFSTSQISKQLHRNVARYVGAAHSLAELVHETR